jgi:hypothetical protein
VSCSVQDEPPGVRDLKFDWTTPCVLTHQVGELFLHQPEHLLPCPLKLPLSQIHEGERAQNNGLLKSEPSQKMKEKSYKHHGREQMTSKGHMQ